MFLYPVVGSDQAFVLRGQSHGIIIKVLIPTKMRTCIAHNVKFTKGNVGNAAAQANINALDSSSSFARMVQHRAQNDDVLPNAFWVGVSYFIHLFNRH